MNGTNDVGGRPAETDVDRRTVDALTRYLTVLPEYGRAAGADYLYVVVSDSGREYLVDARTGACECPDYRYRGTWCIHQRRVAAVRGELEIPDAVAGDVDPNLGRHVDEGPLVTPHGRAGAAASNGEGA